MTTLTEFLLARVAEDEANPPHDQFCQLTAFNFKRPCACDWPKRVLAECEAKRRIVAAHNPREFFHPGGSQIMCGLDSDDVPCFTLRTLAAIYSDHPDYCEEWRP